MKLQISLILFSLTFLLSSCFKTAEQIERDKKIDQVIIQMSDSQSLISEMTIKTQDLQTKIDSMKGELEEKGHSLAQTQEQSLAQIQEDISAIKNQVEALKKEQEQFKQELAQIRVEQKNLNTFTKKVNNIVDRQVQQKTENKKKAISEALLLIDKKKYKAAEEELGLLLNDQKLSNAEKNKVYHGLGLIQLRTGKAQDAIVYFSKIYTRWPKSSLAASSIFHIGKCLQALQQQDEALASFEETLQKYPQSSFAKKAKNEIDKLKRQ